MSTLYLQEKERDRANLISSQALERIAQEDLCPTPEIYELWYVYYARSSVEVVRAIDAILSNKGTFSGHVCEQLHERLLSDKKNEELIRHAGDQINTTIQDVTGIVQGVRTSTLEYNDALKEVHETLKDDSSADDVRKAIQGISEKTQNMLQQNETLEEQLTKSTEAIAELKRDLEHVRKEAMTDGLTGLSNRKAFDSELKRVAAESKVNNTVFTLLMIDIDHFKSFNDNFGHQVGDQVLRLVARTLRDGVKGKDFASRYGGEEFAIILPDTDIEKGMAVANSLRKIIATKDVVNRSTGDVLGRITMSVGVAESMVGENLDDLIERADGALYTAKHNGRNQVAAAPSTQVL